MCRYLSIYFCLNCHLLVWHLLVTALVTSTKLSYVEPSYYLNWCSALTGIAFHYLSRPVSLAVPRWVAAVSTTHGFSHR